MNTESTKAGLRPGDKLDKYDVLEQIASGGMSIVWKGYDRLLGKHVAIKQIALDDHAASGETLDGFRDRFRKEAALQRKISVDQKHLVRVYDFIDDERGLFIVMEYVDGPSLEQILQQLNEPMETRQALGIIGATARALQAIHDQDVLHRDLKPSNILLPRDGGLKVCDFGLATLMADQDAQSLGSVRYMAPESFGSEKVDQRADLYSLGMVAYELLAGRPAFEEAFRLVLRDQRNQAMRWMKWHTNPRAKAPPLKQINPKIDESLSDLVARMMEKDPAARIEKASHALKAIRRHVTGETEASAARATTDARARAAAITTAAAQEATAALPKKSKLPLILAGTLVFWLLVGVGVFFYFQAKGDSAEQAKIAAAQATFDAATAALGEKRYADALNGYESLAAQWPDHPNFGRNAKGFGLFARAMLALSEHRYSEAETLLLEVDAMNVFVHDRDRIQDELRRARAGVAFAKEIEAIEALIAAGNYDGARLRLAEQRQLIHTEERQTLLSDVAQRIEGQAQAAALNAIIERATALAASGDRPAAMALLREQPRFDSDFRLKELHDRIDRDERYATAMADAEAAVARGDLPAAIQAYDTALAIRSTPELVKTANQTKSREAYERGMRLLDQGQVDEARKAFMEALSYPDVENALAKQALASIATTEQALEFERAGDAADQAGNFDQAIKHYENALAISANTRVTDKLRTVKAKSFVARGRSLLAQRKITEARQVFKDAQLLSASTPGVAEGLAECETWAAYLKDFEHGEKMRKESRYGDALRAYRRALEVMQTAEVEERIQFVQYDQFIAQARIYMDQKNWEGARASLRQAAEVRQTDEVRELFAQLEKLNPAGP